MELPIFSDNLRSSASWSATLEHARERWQQARVLAEGQARLEARLRTQQLSQALRRAGHEVTKEQIARLVVAPPESIAAMSTDEQIAVRLLRAARLVSAWAKASGAEMTVARLSELYGVLSGSDTKGYLFRTSEAKPLSPAHNPVPAAILPRLVENALDWFIAPSFFEIHAVEQASLVYLRMLDLQPFPSESEQIALLAASFYTERAGLPPLIIYADEITTARYSAVIDAAFRMLTQPLVEFFAESLTRTIEAGLAIED
jgi:Fic family protein